MSVSTVTGFSLFSLLRDIKESGQPCSLLCDSDWTLMCLNVVFSEKPDSTEPSYKKLLPFIAHISDGRVKECVDCTGYSKAELARSSRLICCENISV